MAVTLTNKWDLLVADKIVELLNELALDVIPCTAISVGEDQFDNTYFTAASEVPSVAASTWDPPEQDGDYYFTKSLANEVVCGFVDDPVSVVGIVLKSSATDDEVVGFITFAEPVLMEEGETLSMDLKMWTSDKETP